MSRRSDLDPGEVVDLLLDLPRMVERERWRRGLSQRQAAKQSGLSFATFSRCEAGSDLLLSSALELLRWLGDEKAKEEGLRDTETTQESEHG